MALVTVQRSPSPSNTPESLSTDFGDCLAEAESPRSPHRSRRSKSALKRLKKFLTTVRFVTKLRFSENYLTVKGAALILPQAAECVPAVTSRVSHGGDIQHHLQSMFYLLRPQDTIKVAVELESAREERSRYMVVVSTIGRQDSEESTMLGIDITNDKATIGLVLAIWGDMAIRLDGDGGFSITTNERHQIFKPVSVQAMWSGLQSLIKVRDLAHVFNYYPNGLTHTWVSYYESRINSDQISINEWNTMEDIESHRSNAHLLTEASEKIRLEGVIRNRLKEIMMTVDLEEVTSKYLRIRLEESLDMSLMDYRAFIDQEMIVILQQLDSPSRIFDFLYLGSEWNASNLEELKQNGVGYILNVTREIDNFFPGTCQYKNVRVYDIEGAELLKHWDNTYRFICKARQNRSKVLVHCKMGVSRSASTVIAFAMKEYGWSLDKAYHYVKQQRSCIKPNPGFMHQLETYEGILDASKQRHNLLWRSASAGNLEANMQGWDEKEEELVNIDLLKPDKVVESVRPRSWSPDDSAAELLFKAHDFASGEESSDDEHPQNHEEQSMAESEEDYPAAGAIPFNLDSCDEYEVSSRSADSLDIDEAFPEVPYSDPVEFPENTNVLLLNVKPRPDVIQPIAIRIESDSDNEDFGMQDSCKVERGFYDISMLTGGESGQANGQECQACASAGASWGGDMDYLHPDVKLESELSKHRKKQRMIKLLTLSQAKPERQPEGLTNTSTPKKSSPKSPLAARVRPDDYWIKETPPSPTEEDSSFEEELEMALASQIESTQTAAKDDISEPQSVASNGLSLEKGAIETDKPKVIVVDEFEKPKAQSPASNVDTAETECAIADENLKSDTKAVVIARDNATDPDVEQNGQRSLISEIDGLQHYQMEDIPWNPGTVKRQKLDLEGKLKSVTPELDVDLLPMGNEGTEIIISKQDSDDQTNAVCQDVETQDTEEEGLNKCPSEPAEITCESPVGSPKGSPVSATKQPVSSIYETEEIELEPGLVLRTKMEIEERNRSGSSVDSGVDIKPVQRSVSLKSDAESRKKREKDSERRKTCLPVIRPALSSEALGPTEDLLLGGRGEESEDVEEKDGDLKTDTLDTSKHSTSSQDDSDDDISRQTACYKIGQEDVEMEEGKVKRRTRDFEDLSKEEMACLLAVPIRERERSQSPFIEEGIAIETGSVLKQTRQMEHKYGGIAIDLQDGDEAQSPTDSAELGGQYSSPDTSGHSEISSTNDIFLGVQEPELVDDATSRLDKSSEGCKPSLVCNIPDNSEGVPSDSEQSPSCGIPVYDEEGIEFQVGKVQLQRQALEAKAVDEQSHQLDKGDDEFKMSAETLRLIREIGSTFLECPKEDNEQTDYPSHGGGLVRKITRTIEETYGTQHDQAVVPQTDPNRSLTRKVSLDKLSKEGQIQIVTLPTFKQPASAEDDIEVMLDKPKPDIVSDTVAHHPTECHKDPSTTLHAEHDDAGMQSAKSCGDLQQLNFKSELVKTKSGSLDEGLDQLDHDSSLPSEEELKVKDLVGIFENTKCVDCSPTPCNGSGETSSSPSSTQNLSAFVKVKSPTKTSQVEMANSGSMQAQKTVSDSGVASPCASVNVPAVASSSTRRDVPSGDQATSFPSVRPKQVVLVLETKVDCKSGDAVSKPEIVKSHDQSRVAELRSKERQTRSHDFVPITKPESSSYDPSMTICSPGFGKKETARFGVSRAAWVGLSDRGRPRTKSYTAIELGHEETSNEPSVKQSRPVSSPDTSASSGCSSREVRVKESEAPGKVARRVRRIHGQSQNLTKFTSAKDVHTKPQGRTSNPFFNTM